MALWGPERRAVRAGGHGDAHCFHHLPRCVCVLDPNSAASLHFECCKNRKFEYVRTMQ